jgi:hypothetical protein
VLIKEMERELEANLIKMRQCPALIEQMLTLVELSIEAYQAGCNAQVTLHFKDGLIRKSERTTWKCWKDHA